MIAATKPPTMRSTDSHSELTTELLSCENVAAFEVGDSLGNHRGFLGCLGRVVDWRDGPRLEHRIEDAVQEPLSLITW